MIAIDDLELGITRQIPDEHVPYVRLWATVFYQALADAARYRADKGRFGACYNKDCRQANYWLWSDDDSPPSFVWMCRVFGYEPDVVRDGFLRNWRKLLINSKELQEEN